MLARPFQIQNGAVSGVTSAAAILSSASVRLRLCAIVGSMGNGSEQNGFPLGKDVRGDTLIVFMGEFLMGHLRINFMFFSTEFVQFKKLTSHL